MKLHKNIRIYSLVALFAATANADHAPVHIQGQAHMPNYTRHWSIAFDYGQVHIFKAEFTYMEFDDEYCASNPCSKKKCPMHYVSADNDSRTRKKRSPMPEGEPRGSSPEGHHESAPEGMRLAMNYDDISFEEYFTQMMTHGDLVCDIPCNPGDRTEDTCGKWPSDWDESVWCDDDFDVEDMDLCDPDRGMMCNEGSYITIEQKNAYEAMDMDRFINGQGSSDSYRYQGCKFNTLEDKLNDPDDGLVEVTTDCRGNPLPAGKKFYKPTPVYESTAYPQYNTYVKHNSAYHFADKPLTGRFAGMDGALFTRGEAFEYCNSLGLEATMVWCPGNFDENHILWEIHPHQPVIQYRHKYGDYGKDDYGVPVQGIWTGVFQEYKMDQNSRYFCGENHTNHWYEQEYFWWRYKNANNKEPQYTNRDHSYFENSVLMKTGNPSWEDWCWNAAVSYIPEDLWVRAGVICEMNCDMIDVDPVKPENVSECATPCEGLCYKGECICIECHDSPRYDELGRNTGECKDITDVEEEIPVDDAIPEILHNCPEEITPEEVEELKLHGCHCVKLGELTNFIQNLGGLGKVDMIDEACMKWNQNRRCIVLPGGDCFGEDIETIKYEISINHYLGTISCERNMDKCSESLCLIDGYWTMEIIKGMRWIRQYGNGNFTAYITDPLECPHCDVCIPPTSCVGQAPHLRFDKDLLH